eukprot:TRINITY_DN7883_c0_g1_i1.p1 TRINITY_DN7883_c0_g1~~TRINITY_DN7883_c0_g1_i1.p1  ORF type:complete len:452 (+),score=91.06 TRINITY_DN7883_c0_g1_i1:185-1540(+)
MDISIILFFLVLPVLHLTISLDKQQAKSKEVALQSFIENPVWNFSANFDVSKHNTLLFITLFNQQEELPMAQCALPLRAFLSAASETAQWHPLRSSRDTDCGEVLVGVSVDTFQGHIGRQSFDLLGVLGKGGFGKVLQVQKKDTQRIYAMKILRKSELIQKQEVEHVMSEQQVMKQIDHTFIVGLKYSFQTEGKLYMVMDYINGGELFYHLRREGRFTEERSRFYAAEIILAIGYLHKLDLIYRDLKPENILLDMHGHVCITDFGLAKTNMGPGQLTYTFCGTAEYLAPEILDSEGYSKSVDWWSVGILLYEMIVGETPFVNSNHQEMYRRIIEGVLHFPQTLSDYAKSLIAGLLQVDPTDRLGSGLSDAEEIKSHPFFAPIDWLGLSQRRVNPPFRPRVRSPADSSNFDPVFTKEPPTDSPTGSPIDSHHQILFRGFSFTGTSPLDVREN